MIFQLKKIIFSLAILLILASLIILLPESHFQKKSKEKKIYGIKSKDTSKNSFKYPQNDVGISFFIHFQ